MGSKITINLISIIALVAIYFVTSEQYKLINADDVITNITKTKNAINGIQKNLQITKNRPNINNYNLAEQDSMFSNILNSFNVTANEIRHDKYGYIYAVSGDTSSILILAYKTIQETPISLRRILLKNKNAVLEVQIFGVVKNENQ